MNIYEVKVLARELAQEHWGMKLNIPVVENGRLTRSLGLFYYDYDQNDRKKIIPLRIEIAKRLLKNYERETIVGVLKHELCHWALGVQGKPFNDGHPVFENELKRVGASSTFTIQLAGTIYTVLCSKCKKQRQSGDSKGRLNKFVDGKRKSSRYTSGCCSAKMVWGPTFQIGDPNVGIDNTLPRSEQSRLRRQAASAAMSSARQIAPPSLTPPTRSLIVVSAKLNEILIPGARGVSNKQMIPAIMKAIDLNNKDLLHELKLQYPDVFEGSCKYLNKTYKSQFEILVG